MRLWADFNELDGDSIWTSLRLPNIIPEGEPEIDQWIELWDHEGHLCDGIVTKIDYPIIWLKLDLSTWISARRTDKSLKEMEETISPFVKKREFQQEISTAGNWHDPSNDTRKYDANKD